MLYGIKDCANLTVISSTTGKPVLYTDYAQISTIEYTAESMYAYNKNVKAIRWDSQREGTFKTELEIFETKWIALLFGTAIASGSIDVAKREVLAVNAGGAGAELAETPKSGSLTIFKLAASGDKNHGTEQTSGNPATTENTYSIATKALTFNATTFSTSSYVVAYYLVTSTKSKFTVDSSSFPSGYKIYLDTAIRGTNQTDIFVQYQLLNVKPKSNVTLTMDAKNVTKLSIDWDIMADDAGNMMHYLEV